MNAVVTMSEQDRLLQQMMERAAQAQSQRSYAVYLNEPGVHRIRILANKGATANDPRWWRPYGVHFVPALQPGMSGTSFQCAWHISEGQESCPICKWIKDHKDSLPPTIQRKMQSFRKHAANAILLDRDPNKVEIIDLTRPQFLEINKAVQLLGAWRFAQAEGGKIFHLKITQNGEKKETALIAHEDAPVPSQQILDQVRDLDEWLKEELSNKRPASSWGQPAAQTSIPAAAPVASIPAAAPASQPISAATMPTAPASPAPEPVAPTPAAVQPVQPIPAAQPAPAPIPPIPAVQPVQATPIAPTAVQPIPAAPAPAPVVPAAPAPAPVQATPMPVAPATPSPAAQQPGEVVAVSPETEEALRAKLLSMVA